MTGAPFQNLVPEVLSQIFLLCLPTDNTFPTTSLGEAPLKLGRVCSHWRQVALSTPSLWSSIKIFVDGCLWKRHDRDPLEFIDSLYAKALSAYMDRSRQLPVSIEFRCHLGDSPLIIKEILLHSSRWKCLRAYAPVNDIKKLLDRISDGAPLLQSLMVSTVMPNGLPLDLTQAPLLTSLQLSGRIYNLKPHHPPLVHLRTLELPSKQSFGGFVTWIQHCPALEYLSLNFNNTKRLTGRLPEAILADHPHLQLKLPSLTVLKLSCNIHLDSQLVETMFDRLKAPALRRLNLTIAPDYSSPYQLPLQFLPNLLDFLRRCSTSLRMLWIRSPCISQDHLLNILAVVPSLHGLELAYDSLVDDKVLNALTFNPTSRSGTPLCPELRRIWVTLGRPRAKVALIQMISSRCGIQDKGVHDIAQKPSRLEDVSFECYPQFSRSLAEHPTITRWVDQGLKVTASCLFDE